MQDPNTLLLAGLVDEVARLISVVEKLQPQQQPEWMSTTDALEAFKRQAISHRKELLSLVYMEVLPVDGTHVRNVSLTPGRASYEFHVERCIPLIETYKALSPEDRQAIYGKAA
ncbi:MAG: hypothetical protein AAF609_22370 [Cyanobacteria bacterium P01_C01_bin.120]